MKDFKNQFDPSEPAGNAIRVVQIMDGEASVLDPLVTDGSKITAKNLEAIATRVTPNTVYSTHDYQADMSAESKNTCELIRAKCKELEALFSTLPEFEAGTFSDRCYKEAYIYLELTCMYMIKGIAFLGKSVGVPDSRPIRDLAAIEKERNK